MSKKSKNFRLTNDVQKVLEALAEENNCTQTAVIQDILLAKAKELGIDEEDKKVNIEEFSSRLLSKISNKLNEQVLLLNDGIQFTKRDKGEHRMYSAVIRPGTFLKINLGLMIHHTDRSNLIRVTINSSVTYEETGHSLSSNRSEFLVFDTNDGEYVKIISDKILEDCLNYSKILRLAKSSIHGSSFKGFKVFEEGKVNIPVQNRKEIPKEFKVKDLKVVDKSVKEESIKRDIKVLESLGVSRLNWTYEVEATLLSQEHELDPEYISSVIDLDFILEDLQRFDHWALNSVYGSSSLEPILDCLTTYRADFYKKNSKNYYLSGIKIKLLPEIKGTLLYLGKEYRG